MKTLQQYKVEQMKNEEFQREYEETTIKVDADQQAIRFIIDRFQAADCANRGGNE